MEFDWFFKKWINIDVHSNSFFIENFEFLTKHNKIVYINDPGTDEVFIIKIDKIDGISTYFGILQKIKEVQLNFIFYVNGKEIQVEFSLDFTEDEFVSIVDIYNKEIYNKERIKFKNELNSRITKFLFK